MKEKKAAPQGNGITRHDKTTKKDRCYKPHASRYLSQFNIVVDCTAYVNSLTNLLSQRRFSDDSSPRLIKCFLSVPKLKEHQAEGIGSTWKIIARTKSSIEVVGKRITIGQYDWPYGNGANGTADKSAIIDGRSEKIDIKIGSEPLNYHISNYQEYVKKAGGLSLITWSFEQFYQCYLQTVTS